MTGKHGGKRPGAGRKPKAQSVASQKPADQPTAELEQATDIVSEREIAALARSFVPAAIKRLAHISQHAKSETAAVSASNALLDRGFGRRPLFAAEKPEGTVPARESSQPAPQAQGEQLDLDDWANSGLPQ